MDYQQIIDKYYPEDNPLRYIFMTHSTLVTKRAVRICDLHPELSLDRQFVIEAAMLHDIGIFIHGRIGAELVRAEGFPKHARVCERHTGAGITKEEIIKLNLPLPHEDFLPETMEEKVICYADKFYSKTHPEVEKTIEQAKRSLKRFGEDGVERFKLWEKLFE